MSKPKILVISLGGTILMSGKNGQGVTPNLNIADLTRSIPQLNEIASTTFFQICQKPSCALTLGDLASVAKKINKVKAIGIQGVVVTQGTDSIEESAFALDLFLDGSIPVVVTGAMRDALAPGADGPANLVAAVKAASDSSLQNYGVLVLIDNELHLATHVVKSDSCKSGALTSPKSGSIGRVVEDRVVNFFLPRERLFLKLENAFNCDKTIPQIGLVFPCIGDDPSVISAYETLDIKGLVVAGMGAGHIPPQLVPRVQQLARNIPVVLCSRCSGGHVFQNTYGYSGGKIDLFNRGILSGGWLSPFKTKILLTLLINLEYSIKDISDALRYFDGGLIH